MFSSSSQDQGVFSDPAVRFVVMIGMLIIAGYVSYLIFQEWIHWGLVLVNRLQLFPLVFVSEKVAAVHEFTGTKPAVEMSLQGIMNQIEFTGSYYRWVFAPILIGLGVLFLSYSVAIRYAKVYTMKLLMKVQVENFPLLAPVVGLDLEKMDMFKGPWRSHDRVINWVMRHELLIDAKGVPLDAKRCQIFTKHGYPNLNAKYKRDGVVLDVDRAIPLLEAQLGGRFAGWELLPDYARGIAAAFIAFGHGEKNRAYAILDRMSLSSTPDQVDENFIPKELDISEADEVIAEYQSSPEMKEFLGPHVIWRHVLFARLRMFALKKGVLENSNYKWLRPVDRTLYYTLLSIGGDLPYAEAQGPFVHLEAEENIGRGIDQPEISAAILGTKKALFDEGWTLEEVQVAKS